MAYIYILALFFFTISHGQVTSWTGAGQNSSIANSDNWSNGIPGPDSTVYINSTSCGGSCDVTFDENIVIGTLIVDSPSSSVYLRIVGSNLTISTQLTIGNPTTTSSVYIVLTEGAIFEIGQDSAATYYYTSSNPIYANDDTQNWFVNKGTITFYGIAGTTTYNSFYFGDSSYGLNVNSWGNWVATDGLIYVQFYYSIINVYAGSFTGTILNTETTPSINFYYSDVVLQQGANDNFNVVSFTSGSTQSSTIYPSSTPPNILLFNSTDDITVSNSTFSGTNIVLSKNQWFSNINLTNYAMVNITANDVTAYFNGGNYFEDAILIGLGTNGIFEVAKEATVTMTDYFSIYGGVTLINYGTWIYDSSDYLYFDVAAYWVNLGLLSVIRASNCFIWGSQFPNLSARTDAGTIVNYGTIQFTSGGGLNFQDGTGSFYQCDNGIIKLAYGYPDAGTNPGTITLPETLGLDGYLAILYDNTDSSAATTIFYWKENADNTIFDGSIDVVVKGDGDKFITPFICFDPTSGYAQIYDFTYANSLKCPLDAQTQFLGGLPGADVCANLPAEVTALKDGATCTSGDNCGIDTGAIGGGGNGGDGSGALANAASLAFLVSLVCLLLKF